MEGYFMGGVKGLELVEKKERRTAAYAQGKVLLYMMVM
jgi:hypothetical protein